MYESVYINNILGDSIYKAFIAGQVCLCERHTVNSHSRKERVIFLSISLRLIIFLSRETGVYLSRERGTALLREGS